MFNKHISGIQQIGIGIPNVHEAKRWYRDHFSMSAQVFDDAGEAALMIPYTNGKVESRHAALTLNMNGGGGMEIWQYTSKTPVKPAFLPVPGDLGFYGCVIKSPDPEKAWKAQFSSSESLCVKDPEGNACFWTSDPYGNPIYVTKGHDWFQTPKALTGGVYGAVIGVSNMEKSVAFYRDVLGVGEVIFDREGLFEDLPGPASQQRFRRVRLRRGPSPEGAFSKLLGGIQLDLIQSLETPGRPIFENRCWGDSGYIHLCFDVLNMSAIQNELTKAGFPFTVDSGSTFDMGEGAGRFAYCEDPDGALIELVETHRVPIMKKWGWYLNLKKRGQTKRLPDWMIRLLGLSKVN